MRTVHLVNYSESLNSAEYRVTATPGDDGMHLTIVQVPDDVRDQTVARLANETCLAVPLAGAGRSINFGELGRGRFINLYRAIGRT